MAKQTINIGTTANDGTGDAIRAAFGKVNDNFTEIYTANTGVNTGDQNLSAYATTAAVAAGYQPLDSDLTAISALTTTAYGRALLSTADAATLRSAMSLGTTDAPTFLAQTLTGQSLTGTQATSLVDLSATWNTTGNPSLIYGRVTNINSGTTANLIDLGTFAGGSLFKVDKTGATFASGGLFGGIASTTGVDINYGRTGISIGSLGAFGFTSGTLSDGRDTLIFRDAAGILAQRNGVNAQAFRVYNTFPGTTANEWFEIDWKTTANTVRLFTNHAGTGGARSMDISAGATLFLGAGSSSPIRMYSGGVERWNISATGHFLAASDNAHDIGASGANRPRDIWSARILSVGGSGSIRFDGRSRLLSSFDGIIQLSNALENDFNRIQLGGTTSAFPAISRSGTGIAIVAADGSQFTPLTSLYQRFGTGTPEGVVNAPAGAIYHRSDGGTGTSFYVKESLSGSTGWVAK